MKNIFYFFIFIFYFASLPLFARGSRDKEEEITVHNNEWILCITEFDVSSLPPQRAYIFNLISRKLVEKITSINYRTRVSSEYAYYEEYAWDRERAAAARALNAKIEERAQMVFRGEPDWRYRRNLARVDAEIVTLREKLEEVENRAPLVNEEPVFNLTRGNLELSFPTAPADGGEYRFCTSQNADAFLIGRISDFHGRYLLSVRLYTIYTRTFVWQDNILFSHEDVDRALEEITRRLLVVLSGNQSATVAITAQPEDALLLINRSFAGRGETNVMEYPPGTITVTASAPNHESLTFETNLIAGELASIRINLSPIEFGEMEIFGDEETRIYHGALYVGNAPYTLRLPINQLEYIEVETTEGDIGSAVFRTPMEYDFSNSISIPTYAPLESGRVERARRHYYWSLGGTWITGIAAWITYYSRDSVLTAYNSSTGAARQELADQYNMLNDVWNGVLIAGGVMVSYMIFRLVRYLYISNKGNTPVVTPQAARRTADVTPPPETEPTGSD